MLITHSRHDFVVGLLLGKRLGMRLGGQLQPGTTRVQLCVFATFKFCDTHEDTWGLTDGRRSWHPETKQKTANVSKFQEQYENSTEFGGDLLHGTINVKIPVFKIRRHGRTVFHGQGEFLDFQLCLLSPDNTKSHGWVGTHVCQVRIHGPPNNDFCAWSNQPIRLQNVGFTVSPGAPVR